MTTRIPLILIVAMATALIAAGCGDDDEETTTATTTTEAAATGASGATGPQSEFAQQGNEICTEGNKELDAEAKEFFGDAPQGQEPSQEEQQRFAEEVAIPNIEQQVEGVTSLPPPEGEEDLFDEFVDQAQSDLDAIKSDPSALLRQQGGTDPFEETNTLARELGLTECADG